MTWEEGMNPDDLVIEVEEGFWQTKDGKVMTIEDMEDSHLLNVREFIKKRIEESIGLTYHFKLEEIDNEIRNRHLDSPKENWAVGLSFEEGYISLLTNYHITPEEAREVADKLYEYADYLDDLYEYDYLEE